jgi:hypothetical protein
MTRCTRDIRPRHFGSLEFILDCFDSLSLSPKRSGSGVVFMGTTRNGLLSLSAMIEDSTDEFNTASSGEGSSGLPASRRHSTGAPLAAIATTPWPEDALTIQTMMMVPPWTLTLQPDIGLAPERRHTFQDGYQA